MKTQNHACLVLFRRLWLGIVLLLAVLATACASAPPATPTATPTNTVAPPPATSAPSTGVPSAQTAGTPEPEPNFAMPDELPMKGAKEAKVVMVEFSDFQ